MPSSDRREEDVATAPGRKASAQRDALLELLSVLAHDLNNPLQTLLVLSELALDESPAGTEPYDRARQCLAAADRLKILTQAMGGSLRGRPQGIDPIWSRLAVMLGRRLERYGVVVTTDLGGLAAVSLPADAEWAMLVAVLAVIATASTSSLRRHELAVLGQVQGDEPTIVLALVAVDGDGNRRPLVLEPRALERLREVVPTTVEGDGERVRFGFARAS